mgnify:CR=1 FL=1
MQIFIHLPQNEIITLDVNSDATISQLKNQIYKRIGTPINIQRLIFGGKQQEIIVKRRRFGNEEIAGEIVNFGLGFERGDEAPIKWEQQKDENGSER